MPIKEEAPKGVCGKCGMIKISREGVSICPQCDTASEPSGLVNNIEDPGHAAMDQVLKTNVPSELPKVKERPVPVALSPNDTRRPIRTYADILYGVESLPMPDSMKAIKKLLKVKQLLTELSKEK